MKSNSNSVSSTEDVEAIVRRVMADVLAKQHSGTASRTSSGEMLNLEDFELPDDLGSIFTAVTLPNEIKDSFGIGKGEKNDGLVVSEKNLDSSRFSHHLNIKSHRYNNHSFTPPQNDADTVPDSLCDEAGERIGDLEQKLALSNASKDMVMEEIEHLKSQAVDDFNELAEYRKENLSLIEEKEELKSALIGVEAKVVVATEEIGHLKSVIEKQSQEIEDLNEANKKRADLEVRAPDHLNGGLAMQAQMCAKMYAYQKTCMALVEERNKLEEKLRRQKHELATLNKKVQNTRDYNRNGSVSLDLMAKSDRQKKELTRLNKQVVELKSKASTESANDNHVLVARIERQKKELAILNKLIEVRRK